MVQTINDFYQIKLNFGGTVAMKCFYLKKL